MLRDLIIIVAYWLLTTLAVVVEVQLSAVGVAKLTFAGATCVYIISLLINHVYSDNRASGGFAGSQILWLFSLIVIGIYLAIVIGTNLKFALGGTI